MGCFRAFALGSKSAIPCSPMERIEVGIAKEWLSVADISGYMDVSTYVVTGVLRSGDLPAVKFGREWRVARIDFENWINESRSAG